MATRRHRIVIKPNIRPTAAKPAATNTPKQKAPNAASECPSPAIKLQLVSQPHEETHHLSANEDDQVGDNVTDVDNSAPVSTSIACQPEKDAVVFAASDETDSEQKVPYITKETSEIHNEGESAHTRKEKVINDQDVNADDVSVNVSINTKLVSNADTPPAHQIKISKPVTVDTVDQAVKQNDVIDSEEVIKDLDDDDDGVTPSEADGSCMSDIMSQDPDNERREEVGDKAQKKSRRHKSKKLRAEPLPSREKSPDRQKMKMSDLLCWNPQQNFFPRKNKKKSPLKSDNRSLSPTSSLTTIDDDDKESTNQSASLPAPQVMIGPDGSVILNAESLMIQTQKDDRPKEVLEDNDEDRYLNTNSYRKYKKAKLWTEIETEKFFVGLSMCGTDFSLLTNLLTNRSRRELKNKFHREERRNRELIDKALSTRQQYDLTPFKKMAAEEDKKVKKKTKKQMKKETVKDEKVARKRGRKRKKESVDEEGDWVPEYNEEDEENQSKNVDNNKSADISVAKHRSKVKQETGCQSKSKPVGKSFPEVVLEDTKEPFLPGYIPASVQSVQDSLATQVPLPAEYTDLDNPRMRSRPSKTYSKHNPQSRESQQQTPPQANTGTNFTSSCNVIQAIPGSTQVQIEMEGVQNPVQGVLIPSHMVPHIAPQLGVYGSAEGMQVLLVQEETESGTMVHVYVLPESNTARGENVDMGPPGPGSQISFSSSIPSPHPTTAIQNPHPTTSIQSPHPVSPFPTCNSHPLSSVCSPQPIPTYHSPPTVCNPTPGETLPNPQAQTHNSHLPNSHNLLSQLEQQDVVTVPPSARNFPISRQSQDVSAIKHNNSSPPNCEHITSHHPRNNHTQISTSTVFTPPPHQSALANTEVLPHDISVAVTETSNLFPHISETTETSHAHHYNSDVIVVLDDDQTVKPGDIEACATPYNSTNIVVVSSEVIENDCIIVNSDKPQSQVSISEV